MDIKTLKDRVRAALKDGKYALETAGLSSAHIAAIAKDYFPKATLHIEPDKDPFVETPDSITVRGKGVDNPFKTMSIEALFYLDGDQAALAITAKGGADWKLAAAFPVFSKNLGSKIVFAQTPAPPSLFLLSDRQGGREAGMSFEGTVDFSKMTAGVAAMLGIENEYLHGPVSLKNGGADFDSIDFKGVEHKGGNLWVAQDCTVQFSLVSILLPNPVTNTNGA